MAVPWSDVSKYSSQQDVKDEVWQSDENINPLTPGAAHIRVFIFLLAH